MSDSSSDEFEEDIGQLKKRPSIKQFPPKNTLIMILDQKINKKRSSSAQVNSSKNFAPRLKPVKAKLCPSPILLNEKSPPKYKQEVQNTTISTSSFDSRNEYKKIRIKVKKSIKLINEKVYPVSDFEDNDKKGKNYNSNSDSSKNGDSDKNVIKIRSKNKNNNINKMRLKMTNIRKNSINDIVFDDSNIGKRLKEKSLYIFKNIQSNFINKYRTNKNMNLYPLNCFRYRNKSHITRTNYIPTIIGFLERNKSCLSLNTMGK